MKRGVLFSLVALTLAFATSAEAKLALTFDRSSVHPGQRVRIAFGEYFTRQGDVVHVYLVRGPLIGRVIRPDDGGAPRRLGPPPRLAGVIELGRTTSAATGFSFRVPEARPGRYAAAIWCSTCRYPYVLISFPSSVPDYAYVRPTRGLLRVLR